MPIHVGLSKVNAFRDCCIPTPRELLRQYGMQPSTSGYSINNPDEPDALNVNMQDNLPKTKILAEAVIEAENPEYAQIVARHNL